jgi:predicted AAA+ superfamily ATPase
MEELRRGYQVGIGKLGAAEVDFVCQAGSARVYIQVAYLLASPEVAEREFAPLGAIRDNHPKYVATMDALPPANADGVKRLHLADFLLQPC